MSLTPRSLPSTCSFVCVDADELTEDSLAAFVASWDAGDLETKEFNLPARNDSEEDGMGDAE